ncbi:MAG: hypothetical protein JXQ76_12360, partial [Campylobacterales bacterium]|nr:hypothetical protein [Campylobacterales bacterium]
MRKIFLMVLLFVSMVWAETSDVNATSDAVVEKNDTAAVTTTDDDDLDLDDDTDEKAATTTESNDDDLSLDDDDDDLSLDDDDEEKKKVVVKPKPKKVRDVIYKVDYPVTFDKETTRVVNRTRSLAIKLAKESSKIKTMVELTSSKKVRRKICQRESDALIKCYTFSSGGKILRSVEHFDAKRPKKVNGEYKQYYTAYIGAKNCPFVVWDSEKYAFVSEDDRPLCEDDFYIKYL